ncbi:MAG: GAF domain-containing protein [Gemmatimonadota bacterium]|nr:GAF domain-containing protein [Gemmatimonadota bacterium]
MSPKQPIIQDRLNQAQILLGISDRIAALESLDEILETLVSITSTQLGAERSTIFLNDDRSNELYSRVAQGNVTRRIRMMNDVGIAGHVFQSGEGVIVDDAYADERFNRAIDTQTGFTTKSVLCVPIRTVRDQTIGVIQVLNKSSGGFTERDMRLVEAMTRQAAVALQGAQTIERMRESRAQEKKFVDIVADITSDIDLGSLLQKVMTECTRLLDADRSTLFMNDAKSNELWSSVGQGLDAFEIRFPNHLGIAGSVFTNGTSVNIPYAYADLRFNPSFDKQTGYFTRSILCTPVVNKHGKVIGVTQVLNKSGGPFTAEDESRLKAFTAQIAIALENAALFADIQNMKNYSESMLQSMASGVVTLDEEGRIATCNEAGQSILEVRLDAIVGVAAADFFTDENEWLARSIARVEESGESAVLMDTEIEVGEEVKSANVTILPLVSTEQEKLGTLLMIEDISTEKRMKSTMSRYMDPALVDQLLAGGEDFLGGRSMEATILFSDVRGFSLISEALGPQGLVALLNEYFTLMVEHLNREGGMLDKFIGDAIMAGFGVLVPHDDDEDRAVRCAIEMIRELRVWNASRIESGAMPVEIGIGINTDQVVSGNIGSPKQMDYTIMGDGVNLASRLEGLCKEYSSRILIAQNTVNGLRGTYRIRDVDDVIVKGKTEPARVFEVLDYHSDETFPNLMDVVGHFEEGRQSYRAGAWKRAVHSFETCLSLHAGDDLSRTYLDRIAQLEANPPKQWDGVWRMKTK